MALFVGLYSHFPEVRFLGGGIELPRGKEKSPGERAPKIVRPSPTVAVGDGRQGGGH